MFYTNHFYTMTYPNVVFFSFACLLAWGFQGTWKHWGGRGSSGVYLQVYFCYFCFIYIAPPPSKKGSYTFFCECWRSCRYHLARGYIFCYHLKTPVGLWVDRQIRLGVKKKKRYERRGGVLSTCRLCLIYVFIGGLRLSNVDVGFRASV